jgi:hypothetical protein
MRKACRQGDILIWPIETLPTNLGPVEAEEGRLIVTRGEATGHHHSFPHQRGAVLFRDDMGGLFVQADVAAPLEHQEHATLTVGGGASEVIRQRVMSSGMVSRRVED